jgi:sugar (pentulose or hexulose) kinase
MAADDEAERIMNQKQPLAIGLDLGTSGVRAIALDLKGELAAMGRADLPAEATRVNGPCVEQDPRAWTLTVQAALRELTGRLPPHSHMVGISVDATSGTFVLLDASDEPLTPGIMYNDLRATAETAEADAAVAEALAPCGIRMAPSFALPKLLHLFRQTPALLERCRRIVHQTDWGIGMLCGRYDVTDISTALKTGADPASLAWPAAISNRLGIPRTLLPAVVLPGTVVGQVTAAAAAATGLPAGLPVVAGCTDGTAGCLASGARAVGDLNVTLGSTLVFKAIAAQPLMDPTGAVYNHRHPAGGFMPGAASSTGADWAARHFPGADLEPLGREAAAWLPTGRLAYPLVKQGERFPFACPTASGFGLSDLAAPAERFAAGMEGVAFLERMGIERLHALGLGIGDTVYATGGATAGETWLRIRAAVSRRAFSVPLRADCAVGAAVLAAMPHLGNCATAIAALVRPGHEVGPELKLADGYEIQYQRFRTALGERGYL